MATLTEPGIFYTVEFEPLALLRLPLAAFKQAGVLFERGQDDLDNYEFAVLLTENSVPFALFHYDQQSDATIDVFVPRGSIPPSMAAPFLMRLADEFGIDPRYFTIRGSLDEPSVARTRGLMYSTLPAVPIPIIQWDTHRRERSY